MTFDGHEKSYYCPQLGLMVPHADYIQADPMCWVRFRLEPIASEILGGCLQSAKLTAQPPSMQ